MSLGRSVFTIGGITLLSRIAGFIRDIAIAAVLGAGHLADTFFVAFKLPNFFRHLFAEGAFSAAFVPSFSYILSDEGKEKALKFAASMFAWMFFILLIFQILMQIFMMPVMMVLAPGFNKNPEQLALAVDLARITFPYLMFVSLVSLLGGVLNSFNKFASAAATPILLNLVMVASLYGLQHYTATPAHALAIGVFLSGIGQFAWLYIACRKNNIAMPLRLPKKDNQVFKAFRLMIPGIIGAGVFQINVWIDTLIATLIPGAVSYLYYADRLYQLPLGVIGIAVGTAILPLLSREIREKRFNDAIATFNKAVFISLLFTLPAAVAFLFIGQDIMMVLFERGEFVAKDSHAAAQALAFFALGLPAFVLVKVLVPQFYAQKDTATPVKTAAVCLIVNAVFALSFMHLFPRIGLYGHSGIACATSISGWVNVGLLAWVLRRRKLIKILPKTKRQVGIIFLASLAVGLIVFAANETVRETILALHFGKYLYVFGLIAVAKLIYFLILQVTGIFGLGDLRGLLKRKAKNPPPGA